MSETVSRNSFAVSKLFRWKFWSKPRNSFETCFGRRSPKPKPPPKEGGFGFRLRRVGSVSSRSKFRRVRVRRVRRPPDFTVGNYLHRWFVIPRNRWANVYLHRFHESDEPVPHDHPWVNVSIILRGRYREHYHDGTHRDFGPGSVIFRQARALHWLEILDGPVTTLFLTGRRRREWGFQTDAGWVPWWAHVGEAQRAAGGMR